MRAAAAGRRVEILGRVTRAEVVELMRRSVGLVFPSAWYEGFPLVYAEAMAAGLPVLAWAPNVVSGWVADDGTGMATTWDQDLARCWRPRPRRSPRCARRAGACSRSDTARRPTSARAEALYARAQSRRGVNVIFPVFLATSHDGFRALSRRLSSLPCR